MGHGRGEDSAGDHAVVIVPIEYLVPPQRVEKPADGLAVLSRKDGNDVGRVSGAPYLADALDLVVRPGFGLESDVDLADVVEGGEDAEAREGRLVQRRVRGGG